MKQFLFKHRSGQTPLPPDYHADLIPKNVQSHGELDEHEEQNIALGLSWLEKQASDGIDHLFWRRLHKELFKDVWRWAGKIRKKELQSDEYLRVYQIEPGINQLEGDLKFWIQEGKLDPKEIMARFHERVLTIHPFPNGNGRFSRVLTAHICTRQNFPSPTWGEAYTDQQKRRDKYIEAIIEARKNSNWKDLIDFMYS